MSFQVSFSFPWDKYSELGLLDHGLVFLLLFFFSSLHTVSHRGCTNLVLFSIFLVIAILTYVTLHLNCGFDLRLPDG